MNTPTRRPRGLFVALVLLCTSVMAGPTHDAWTGQETGTFVRTAPKGATYTLIVPDTYDSKRGATLLLWLHGAGDNHANAARAFQGRSFKPEWIVAVPNAQANGSWQMGEEHRVMDVLDQVERDYTVRRSFVAGFSRGGFFTFGFGLKHTDRFVGYLCVAGGLPNPSLVPADKANTFHVAIVHGEADGVVPFTSGTAARDAFKKAGWKDQLFFRSVPGLAHRIDRDATQAALDWLDENAQSLETPRDYAEYGLALLARKKCGRAWWALSQIDLEANAREKWFRKVKKALDTIRRTGAREAKAIQRSIAADRDAKWIEDWQTFRGIFEGTPEYEEVLAAYRELVATHDERAAALMDDAEAARDAGDARTAIRACLEVRDRCYVAEGEGVARAKAMLAAYRADPEVARRQRSLLKRAEEWE